MQTSSIPMWNQDNIDFEKYYQGRLHVKAIALNLNSNLENEAMQKVSSNLIDFYVGISEVVILVVDYHTIENQTISMFAKYTLDQCIILGKMIRLCIRLEGRVKIDQFISLMKMDVPSLKDEGVCYKDKIDEVEIQIGRFNWEEEVQESSDTENDDGSDRGPEMFEGGLDEEEKTNE